MEFAETHFSSIHRWRFEALCNYYERSGEGSYEPFVFSTLRHFKISRLRDNENEFTVQSKFVPEAVKGYMTNGLGAKMRRNIEYCCEKKSFATLLPVSLNDCRIAAFHAFAFDDFSSNIFSIAC